MKENIRDGHKRARRTSIVVVIEPMGISLQPYHLTSSVYIARSSSDSERKRLGDKLLLRTAAALP